MRAIILVVAALCAQAALAVPKIDKVAVTPSAAKFEGGKPPEVQITVSISRTRFDSGGCDARVDFGDGQGRNIDFSVGSTRSLRHPYAKNGSYKVSVKGAGATPCEGAGEAPLTVAGAPEPKKAEPKKAEPKKTDAKKAPAKKPAPKKAAPKKDEAKKDEPK